MEDVPRPSGCGRGISIVAGGFLLSGIALFLLSRSSDSVGGAAWWIFAPGFMIVNVGHAGMIEPVIAFAINTALYSLLIHVVLFLISKGKRI